MKIDEIFEEWEVDAQIDRTDLGHESLNIPKLHKKWLQKFSKERLILKKYRQDLNVLRKIKTEYYMGTIDEETLKEKGWEPNRLKILRGDVGTYIDADSDIVNLTLRIDLQQEVVDVLEAIVKMITNRNFLIKNSIEWQRFMAGG